ncbi:hypothetical protein VTL71DRAFT_6532 [Oculimacula yallundae]|uniref:Uncharacterized protein n=1 Tax=Oculimacula yallundae TaxID=86028 RepID=A0ABR4BYS0_9HELO
MAAFGSMSVGSKFGIVFGCLIGAAFIAGLMTLAWSKRKLRKDTKKAGSEAPTRSGEEKLVSSATGEGDPYGARAIEDGYFGGVSQSRPSSPTPSYVLSPDTPVVDWSKSEGTGGHSASSSTNSLPRSLAPSSLNHTKRKPSPLSLQPPNANPSAMGGLGGSYLPPLPSPRSLNSFKGISPTNYTFDEGDTPRWVSPLDIHFSRPLTPKDRPTSYLPKLHFPGEIEKTGLFVPSPRSSLRHMKSESESIASATASIAPRLPVRSSSRGAKSPMLSVFPPMPHSLPSRASRGGPRSIFPANEDLDQPSTRRSPKDGKTSPQSVPLNDLTPQIATTEEFYFPQDTRSPPSPKQSSSPAKQWDPTLPTFPGPVRCNDSFPPPEAVMRDPVVNVQHVSVSQPSHVRNSSTGAIEIRQNRISASSSIYSTRTSILEYKKDATSSDRSRSRSRSISIVPKADSRNRSASTSEIETRSTSSNTITRARESVNQQHNRTPPSDSPKNRRSRDRDQIRYDPTSTNRTRSGSVQGRDIEFARPGESPFSNSNAMKHSLKSSTSSTSSRSSSYSDTTEDTPQVPQLPSLPPQLVLPVLDLQPGRLRSESETSQGSVSDFYDAYYRQSMLEQKASTANSVPASNVLLGSHSLGVNSRPQGFIGPVVKEGSGRRPAPMRVGETIMEVVSPFPSPLAEKQTFPDMI